MVWTAYSGNAGRVIAYVIGEGIRAARAIYRAVKETRPNIAHIYTDANSCYARAFKPLGAPEPRAMTKAESHLIESGNSRFRDRLARFNRRAKRFSKSLPMLRLTIDLFLARDRQAV